MLNWNLLTEIKIYFYHNSAILCSKILCVNWALDIKLYCICLKPDFFTVQTEKSKNSILLFIFITSQVHKWKAEKKWHFYDHIFKILCVRINSTLNLLKEAKIGEIYFFFFPLKIIWLFREKTIVFAALNSLHLSC